MKFTFTKSAHRGAWCKAVPRGGWFWGVYAKRGTVVVFLGEHTFSLDWY